MAQQQPRREEFGNAPRLQEQERERDVRKNELQESESDRWKEEFGTRAGAADPAAPYAFATGYGAPVGSAGVDVGSGPHGGMADFGAIPGGIYENTTTTTTFSTDHDDNNDPAGGGNRNRSRDDMNMNNINRNLRNRGRDHQI